ncbi:enoyl-CoA hydratase [Pseudorhodoplanes sp.]|uniref:enoyl-CoA hydratase n=1 Tax=Pseudorhodoplanes sp. TaxID=1934341 RepID=UPI003D0EA46D
MNVHARPDGATILLREDRDGIALLTLNNSAARNALSEELIAALHAALDAIGRDAAIRAVVVAANGPAFCAGHDLKQLTARRSDPDGGKAYFRQVMTSCSTMMQAIVALPQPVIACVSGVATAAGCQLVATCDLAVASVQARFATPGVDIGLFCSTPMVALTRNIPRKNAMHMLLTGEAVTADEALRLGLVNKVAPHGFEREAAFTLAGIVASKSKATVKIGKEAFYRQAEMSLAEAYAYAADVMTENMMTRDAREGICAFIDKRNPAWEDR